jgi:hypothetical protein
MTEPQPSYSAYREASFGHGILDIKNRTHAYFGWNRNQDGYVVEADSIWLLNRYWSPSERSSVDIQHTAVERIKSMSLEHLNPSLPISLSLYPNSFDHIRIKHL